MTASLQYFKQRGYHVIVLNFGARSHFSFIDSVFYNAFMFVERCNENNNNNISHQFSADHYYGKTDKFQFEIPIPNVCKSNSNLNLRTKVRKVELCLTCLVVYYTFKALFMDKSCVSGLFVHIVWGEL